MQWRVGIGNLRVCGRGKVNVAKQMLAKRVPINLREIAGSWVHTRVDVSESETGQADGISWRAWKSPENMHVLQELGLASVKYSHIHVNQSDQGKKRGIHRFHHTEN